MISRMGYKPQRVSLLSAPLLQTSKQISIVIPVKDNQKGITDFIETFFHVTPPEYYPSEIIIVDNNSRESIYILEKDYPVKITLLSCSKIGPAAARNKGVQRAITDWILFSDSDCIPTKTFISGYLQGQNTSIGYAGKVKSLGNNRISRYYESQEILMPPKVYENGIARPDYLITANCLILKHAIELTGGFNEDITFAGGEDIDLGFKLLNLGQLSFAFHSEVYHDFRDDLSDFKDRFLRYGRGNRVISKLYGLDLRPAPFLPNMFSPYNLALSFLQYYWLRTGYFSI
ncbi:MAG: glycosyltransferase [Bacteroidetes bacterium]|nr:glycosyltransferase [Bacteroidota bacterium]